MEEAAFDAAREQSVEILKGFADSSPSTGINIFARNMGQETLLSVALRYGDDAKASEETLEYLLKKGAARSVFVQGHFASSLVCTLPMACQPSTAYFEWPPRITVRDEVLEKIDVALAEHISALAARALDSKASSKAGQAAKDESNERDASRGAATATAAGAAATAATAGPVFEHYPQKLNVGDIVRRGPNWSNQDEDSNNGVEYSGIVRSVSPGGGQFGGYGGFGGGYGGGSTIMVEWFIDPSDPNTTFNSSSLTYHADGKKSVGGKVALKHKCDLFAVNPGDPTAKPDNVNRASSSPAKTSKLKSGDIVMLANDKLTTSLSETNPALVKDAQACLSYYFARKVGLVVGVGKSQVTFKTPGSKDEQQDFPVSVMDISSGAFCEYAMDDLQYADGSALGEWKPYTCSIGIDNTPKKRQDVFNVGDEVLLRPAAKDFYGCLYKPSKTAPFTGVVKSVTGTRVEVFSMDASSNMVALQSGINYPQHVYAASDIMHVPSGPPDALLSVGDIVTVSPSFQENGGSAWCLGKIADKTKGVVRYASLPAKGETEQREVLVAALDDPAKVYNFRSSWLQRSPNDGKTRYKVGDRVQLDISTWVSTGQETANKCLEDATVGNYGLVCDIGPKRDGIQRNIEVVACSGSRKGSVSLYPSYSLMPAVRCSVLTDDDRESMAVFASSVLSEIGLDNVNPGTQLRGNETWRFLATMPGLSAKDDRRIVEQWKAWDAFRDVASWPLDEPNVHDGGIGYRPKIAAAAAASSTQTWKCLNEKCDAAGGYDQNALSDKRCVVCKRAPPLWHCNLCTSVNSSLQAACGSCFASKAESDSRGAALVEERKAAAELAATTAADTADAADTVAADEDEKVGERACEKIENAASEPEGKPIDADSEPTVVASLDDGSELDAVAAPVEGGDAAAVFEGGNLDPKNCAEHMEPVTDTPDTDLLPSSSNDDDSVLNAGAEAEAGQSKKKQVPREVGTVSEHLKKLGACFVRPKLAVATYKVLKKTVVLPRLADFFSAAEGGGVCGGWDSGCPPAEGEEAKVKNLEPDECVDLLPATEIVEYMGDEYNKVRSTFLAMADMSGFVAISKGQEVNFTPVSRESAQSGPSSSVADSDPDSSADSDSDSDSDRDKKISAAAAAAASPNTTDNREIDLNVALAEKYFIISPAGSSGSSGGSGCGVISEVKDAIAIDDIDLEPLRAPVLRRQDSSEFFGLSFYTEIQDIADLIAFADKDGNSAAHHAAYIGLRRTVAALIKAGASEWRANKFDDTVVGLRWLPYASGKDNNSLIRALVRRELISDSIVPAALACPRDYEPPKELGSLIEAMGSGDEKLSSFYALDAVDKGVPHALLYKAVFYLQYDYGAVLARQVLEEYIAEVKQRVNVNASATSAEPGAVLDPLYFYALFLLWRKGSTTGTGKPSHAKIDKLRAADALTALRCFPASCSHWLPADERHDVNMQASASADGEQEAEEDDYSDLFPPPGPDDPETLWERLKTAYTDMKSPSMDALMKMVGLREVKATAMQVALSMLVPKPTTLDLKIITSMNFLFMGSSGVGKSTVAELIAKAMCELGYRKSPAVIFVNAAKILSDKDPVQAFMDKVQNAAGGCLCIDEAHKFEPAPSGQRGNDSNYVLDALLDVLVTMRETTTFIMCAYKPDMMRLLAYDRSMDSRFPKQFRFEFVDYTELQLTKILANIVQAGNYRFESKKECGISIGRVLARDLAQGAGKKDFCNGRACVNLVESCVLKQRARLGTMVASKVHISDWDHKTLTRADTVGARPCLEDSPYLAELNAMIGLDSVKEAVHSLMNLQLQNYDARMRGEPAQRISLHRVFCGGPGTGKTTCAKLLGKILKEFNFLSDGDFIGPITPSDLKGSSAGEGCAKTKALLDSAKGKVLFIDEAYNLDPTRHQGSYGAEIIDTILEKIEGNAGSDMCLIMAGYKPEMEQFFRNANNAGLKRRLNLSEAFHFEDFSDEEIKKVLKNQIVNAGLICEPATLDFAVSEISKKRMQDGFGNAGEAEQILTRAKTRSSARKAKMNSAVMTPYLKNLLLIEDFAGEETSVEKAREAFSDLDHIEHIEVIMNRFESLVAVAVEEGRKPHEAIENMHMLFLGPPGTGKTTCARRFATMLKHMQVLPTDNIHVVTAGQLIGSYVGHTGSNTLTAMKTAKGGILFIDEAYGMMPNGSGNFGLNIMQTLLENITHDDFKGKLVVILAGYADQVAEIFSLNPGFQSRFDKVRLEFPEWTGDQAASSLINIIIRGGKTITEEAQVALPRFFNILADLPNWASARDVRETIMVNMEAERSTRSHALSKERREREGGGGSDTKKLGGGPTGNAANKSLPPPIPFELEDVIKTFDRVIRTRGGSMDADGAGADEASAEDSFSSRDVKKIASKSVFDREVKKHKLTVVDWFTDWCGPCKMIAPFFNDLASRFTDVNFVKVDGDKHRDLLKKEGVDSFPTFKFYFDGRDLGGTVVGANTAQLEGKIIEFRASIAKQAANRRPEPPAAFAGGDGAAAPPQVKVKHNVKVKIAGDGSDDDDRDKEAEPDVWAALEEACKQLGMSLEAMETMLEDEASFPPKGVLDIIVAITGCTDVAKIKRMLTPQRAKVLSKVKLSIKESQRKKTEEEVKIQAALSRIGHCCMGFAWLPLGNGDYQCAGGSHFCSAGEINRELQRTK